MADREPGLYWVKTIGGEDVIAEWIGNQWYVLHPSLKGMVLDHDFKEIGERVERQPTSADFTGCAWPKPQPITEAQKTGEWFLVWCVDHWLVAAWWCPAFDRGIGWWDDHNKWLEEAQITHYLPLPPEVKP